jgi:hypothetical protein
MLSKVASLWQMKPIQMGAKTLAAGTAVVGALWVFQKGSRLIFGPREEHAYNTLKSVLSDEFKGLLDTLIQHDFEMVEILARMSVFRQFDSEAFQDIIFTTFLAVETRHEAYEKQSKSGLSATSSFKIRAEYQKAVEKVRLFRAILEQKIPTALEDFDEIAVDYNAKSEQACTDAIQDTFL